MQDGPKAVWSIPYVSVAFFPSLKQNFIAYRSSLRQDCIFEIQQLWQSGFSRVYSNCFCSCWFEPEIIKLVSHHNIVNSQKSTTILNTSTKQSRNLLKAPCNLGKYLKIFPFNGDTFWVFTRFASATLLPKTFYFIIIYPFLSPVTMTRVQKHAKVHSCFEVCLFFRKRRIVFQFINPYPIFYV